jgi:AcrR family transcriptional regulator
MPKIGDERRDARRRQIIDAARTGLARTSYSQLTVDDICAEAGLSKGAFYVHFRSKQALLVALIGEDTDSLTALIAELESGQRPALDKIRRLLRALLERGASPGHAQVRADALGLMLNDDEVRAQFVASARRCRVRLARWIEEAAAAGELAPVPANAFAATLLALADGLMLYHAVDPTGFRWTNIKHALDMLLDGVSEREGAAASR